jgi:predicted dehydrogenase
MTKQTNSAKSTTRGLDRRGFLAAGAGAAGLSIVAPRHVRGSQANSKIELGIIGCGNRGGWIGRLFVEHGGYQIVAAADYFRDRVDQFGEQFGIEQSRRHTGLSGYKAMLDSKPDAVVIETPPYFHPEQAMAAVDAGCHVFQAKPLAVDVPGCMTFLEAGKKATGKGLCLLVDFQTRANEHYQEAVRRVHAGDIGPIVNGEAVYYCGPTWGRQIDALRQDPQNAELQLRSWGLSRVLSGDVITEQNIHALDVAAWIVDADPVKACGTGSRKTRSGEPGDCYDNFAAVFTFPDDVVVNFTSGQFSKGYQDIGCRVFGPAGSIDTHYFGEVAILGEKPYPAVKLDGLFKSGAQNNIATFHQSVTQGDCTNATVAPSVRSNLTTILGRTAAYRRAEVAWKEILEAGEKWHFEGIKRLKA